MTIGDVVLFDALLLQLNRPFQTIGSSIDDVLRSWSRFIPFAKMWGAPEEPDVAAHADFRLSARHASPSSMSASPIATSRRCAM